MPWPGTPAPTMSPPTAGRIMVGTVVAALGLAVILSAILGTYAVWSVETLPTRTRQGGLSIAYNVSAALFAGTVPFLMTVLIATTGSLLVPGPYLMAAAAIGLVAALSMRLMMRRGSGHSFVQA